MIKIDIIAVGKVKDKLYKKPIEEYIKRLRPYSKLNIIELEDEKTLENLSEKESMNIKDIEGERIIKKINPNSYIIVLDILGSALSSEEFSQKINNLSISGKSYISFIIGGSIGLSENVLKRADFKLSFSNMTFPHQLMRLILLEQTYRAFKIMRGEPYHK